MSTSRIAVEVLGHAILYTIGVGMLSSSYIDYGISRILPRGIASILKRLTGKIKWLAGKYLYRHTRIIDVNNNEAWYRMAVYYAIWGVMPNV